MKFVFKILNIAFMKKKWGGGLFGASVLARHTLARAFWRERFGAGTFWRERFGAGTIWRERFGASVLAQIILVLFFLPDFARLFWDNAPWYYWVLAIWHDYFGAG